MRSIRRHLYFHSAPPLQRFDQNKGFLCWLNFINFYDKNEDSDEKDEEPAGSFCIPCSSYDVYSNDDGDVGDEKAGGVDEEGEEPAGSFCVHPLLGVGAKGQMGRQVPAVIILFQSVHCDCDCDDCELKHCCVIISTTGPSDHHNRNCDDSNSYNARLTSL